MSAADEGVVLRASIEPKAGIWVGQQVRLLIDVLGRDGWAQIRKFHPFEVSGASVLQVESQGTRLTDTVSGATWTGQHYEWLVFPQRAGAIAIPPIVVDVETKDVATQQATPVPDQNPGGDLPGSAAARRRPGARPHQHHPARGQTDSSPPALCSKSATP